MRKFIFLVALSFCIIDVIAQTSFPLRVSENRRYFVDQKGEPFLYNADTGWRLFLSATTEEAREYLVKRKQQGFNTIQVMLAFTPEDTNRYGARPFPDNNDFLKPNETFFNHMAEVIRIADSLSMLMVIAQPWLDCCRTGWGGGVDKPLKKNGPQKSYQLGKYLGKKFGSFKNIFWIMGGDHDPGIDRIEIEQLAMGLHETAPHQLITYHAATTRSSSDLFQYAPWLGFSMIYTYWRDKPVTYTAPHFLIEVYEMALREYMKSDKMPFVLGESQYEGYSGNDIGTPYQVRRQAYWTMLCGGAGHAYGSTVWNFPHNWREVANYPGANQLKHFYDFFTSLQWWKLKPDYMQKMLVNKSGAFTSPYFVTAAFSEDSTLLVAYVPSRQQVTVNFSSFKTDKIIARWFNPRSGEYSEIGHFNKLEYFYFTPPADEDWILYIRCE